MATQRGKRHWIGWTLTVLASAVFVFSATMKLVGGKALEEGMAHLGLPMTLVVPLAVLELACVAVYLLPRSSVLGAVLLTGYVGGALCTHLRVGDPFHVPIVLGVFVWLGIYLREERLEALMPLRKP